MNPLVQTQNLTHRAKSFHLSPQTTTVTITSVLYLIRPHLYHSGDNNVSGTGDEESHPPTSRSLRDGSRPPQTGDQQDSEKQGTVPSVESVVHAIFIFVVCRSSNHVPFVW